jgi:hypothetical protein
MITAPTWTTAQEPLKDGIQGSTQALVNDKNLAPNSPHIIAQRSSSTWNLTLTVMQLS